VAREKLNLVGVGGAALTTSDTAVPSTPRFSTGDIVTV